MSSEISAVIPPTANARSGWLFQYGPALGVFVSFTVLWEALVVVFNIQVYLLPAPHVIMQTFADLAGSLLEKGLYTFREALAGYVIGCGLGLLVAVAASRWGLVAEALVPYAVATNAVPIIALAPLSIVWFGIDEGSKIAIVALLTFFPMMLSTYKGLTSCSPAAVELMHSYAASSSDIYLKLRYPNALPYMFNALKLCTTLSLIGAVVGEFFGGPAFRALGVFIKSENAIAHNKEAWSAIIVACGIGLLFYGAVALLERWLMPWHVSHRQGK